MQQGCKDCDSLGALALRNVGLHGSHKGRIAGRSSPEQPAPSSPQTAQLASHDVAVRIAAVRRALTAAGDAPAQCQGSMAFHSIPCAPPATSHRSPGTEGCPFRWAAEPAKEHKEQGYVRCPTL